MQRNFYPEESIRLGILHHYWDSSRHGDVNEGPLNPHVIARTRISGPPLAEQPLAYRAGNWLFIQGGMGAVVVLGLLASGIVAGIVGLR